LEQNRTRFVENKRFVVFVPNVPNVPSVFNSERKKRENDKELL
jgi:hypothetical protein